MPDGMSPEKPNVPISPSVQALREAGPSPGEIKKFQGPSETLPPIGGPENLSVNLRMMAGTEDDNQPEKSPNPAEEVQSYSRRESLAESLIRSAETPQELYLGLRKVMKKLEDGTTPSGLQERYRPQQLYSDISDRVDELYSIEDLKEMGWLISYDDKDGTGKLSSSKYEPTAMRVELVEKEGSYRGERKLYFGTNETRERLREACERAKLEFEARDIIGEHLGIRLSIDIRDSLENLVAIMHSGKVPKFKGDHLQSIFNLPGVKELKENPNNHELGDQVEEAMFLNLVMLHSGNKERMQEFLKKPGSERLIERLAGKWGVTPEQWKHENIGDVELWIEDKDRLLVDGKDKNKNPLFASWRIEAADGRRGVLTKYSNISAWGGNPGEFSAKKEKEFIETTVGGLVGSIEASWIAASMMRATGAYASEGYVALPNGTTHLPLGEGRFISGDDTGKYWAYMFNIKEGLKGRASGLKDMIGRIPDMAMNLFDWAQVVVGEEPVLKPDGTQATYPDGSPMMQEKRRSIWDAWLGTAKKPKIDLLTGKSTDQLTDKEEYRRLGDIDFSSLEREFHGTFTIMQWLMGNERGPVGVFIDAMNVEEFRVEDFSLNALKKKWKYMDIVMNPIVLTKGSPQLYSNPYEAPGAIKKNFLNNLMSARVRSAAFAEGILGSTVKILNAQGTGTAEVSAAKLIETFIDEVKNGGSGTLTELINHYVDNYAYLSERGTSLQAKDVVNNATFKNEVGRVTGKPTTG